MTLGCGSREFVSLEVKGARNDPKSTRKNSKHNLWPETSSLKGASGGRTSITYVGPNCLIGPLVMPLQSHAQNGHSSWCFPVALCHFQIFQNEIWFWPQPMGVLQKKSGV